MTSFSLLDIDQRYMVSSDGKVYGPRGEMSPFLTCKGKYRQVSVGGQRKYVHRLVAESFLPNPEGKRDVAHNDGNGLNNHIDNLRWATRKENMADTKLHGTDNAGENHGASKLAASDIEYIRSQKGAYRGVQRELAAQFSIAESTVSQIMNNTRWAV